MKASSIVWVLLLSASAGAAEAAEQVPGQYENSVTVTARVAKTVYEPGELVGVTITITNHSDNPVYIFRSKSDFFKGSCMLRDANGTTVQGDPGDTPPPPPVDWYIEREGKRIFVVPVYIIEGHGVMEAFVEDALHRHRDYISEGEFTLDFGALEVIHEIEELIVREDKAHRLWVQPSSPMVKMRHKCNNTITIEIRKSPLAPGAAGGSGSPAWVMAAVVILVCCAVAAGAFIVGAKLKRSSGERREGG